MIASKVLMIRPIAFAYNAQTASSNAFQSVENPGAKPQKQALKEFELLVSMLQKNGILVEVIEDKPEPHTPDSIFPNNWFSTHSDGTVFLYPMQAKNRRLEKRPEIIEAIRSKYYVKHLYDLSYLEAENAFLEGTGSMVLDRDNKIAYACLSPRTTKTALEQFCEISSYKPLIFEAYDRESLLIYHTNVMMCLTDRVCVICLESVKPRYKRLIIDSLESSQKTVLDISFAQLYQFAGNMVQLRNDVGDNFLVMSRNAYRSLKPEQTKVLEQHSTILSSPLDTIEHYGGGSVRCMVAEIFLEKIQKSY